MRELMLQTKYSLSVMQISTSADAGTRGRAINFTVGKDADIATVVSGYGGGFGEYCPVEKTQFSFERMLDRNVFPHRVLDAPAIIAQLMVMIRSQSNPV